MFKRCCLVGKFESFHKGHQELLKKAKEECKEVLVFSIRRFPDPIFSEKEREVIAQRFGFKILFLDFDSVRSLTPEDFFVFLKKNGCEKLFVGEDWRFGKDRKGDVKTAVDLGRKVGISVEVVKMVEENGERISTNRIKLLLQEGKIEKANELLGFNYFVLGKVVRGEGLGKKLGFPTVNVETGKKLWIKRGVYVVKMQVRGNVFEGVANYGTAPTVSRNKFLLEVHVPGKNVEVKEGEEVAVEFLKFLRKEKKFSSLEDLKEQLRRDVLSAMKSVNG